MSELANSLTDQNKQELLATWRPRNFDLMDYLARVVRAWPLLLTLVGIGALGGFWYGMTEPRLFESSATFMPPPAELNATATAGTSLSLLSASLQGDMYLYLMTTRTLTQDVVKRTGLAKHLGMEPELARYYMLQRATFDVQRSAVVTIRYKDPDPVWAAKICNAYIDSLYRLEGTMIDSAYLHRLEFFKDQLKSQRNVLEEAEDVLATNQQKLGTLSPEGQVTAEQGQEVGLQGQIDGLDTQIAVLLKSQTEQSPAVIGLRNQQAALRAQLARVKNSGLNPNRGIPGFQGAPEAILQQNRRARDVAEQNTVYQGLLARLQVSQSASADPGPEFEVIDAAIPAGYLEPSPIPIWMTRGSIAGLVLTLLLVFAWPVLLANYQKLRLKVKQTGDGKTGKSKAGSAKVSESPVVG